MHDKLVPQLLKHVLVKGLAERLLARPHTAWDGKMCESQKAADPQRASCSSCQRPSVAQAAAFRCFQLRACRCPAYNARVQTGHPVTLCFSLSAAVVSWYACTRARRASTPSCLDRAGKAARSASAWRFRERARIRTCHVTASACLGAAACPWEAQACMHGRVMRCCTGDEHWGVLLRLLLLGLVVRVICLAAPALRQLAESLRELWGLLAQDLVRILHAGHRLRPVFGGSHPIHADWPQRGLGP